MGGLIRTGWERFALRFVEFFFQVEQLQFKEIMISITDFKIKE